MGVVCLCNSASTALSRGPFSPVQIRWTLVASLCLIVALSEHYRGWTTMEVAQHAKHKHRMSSKDARPKFTRNPWISQAKVAVYSWIPLNIQLLKVQNEEIRWVDQISCTSKSLAR